ncbi:hypothetical protein [Alistipes sp.]|uniref:hypothetical protein n=1 Tax=Alistipes sp. TaxID=1872444 RepID=UPI003AF05DCB
MKRALHILFKVTLKFILLVAVFAVLPIYLARGFDLDLFAFFVTWDFFVLCFYLGASDKNRYRKPPKEDPLFPWWGF